jgi:hypothetical protein
MILITSGYMTRTHSHETHPAYSNDFTLIFVLGSMKNVQDHKIWFIVRDITGSTYFVVAVMFG